MELGVPETFVLLFIFAIFVAPIAFTIWMFIHLSKKGKISREDEQAIWAEYWDNLLDDSEDDNALSELEGD